MFFFFQAEDGIRDLTVTGVQTCALPISRAGAQLPSRRVALLERDGGAAGAQPRRPAHSLHRLPPRCQRAPQRRGALAGRAADLVAGGPPHGPALTRLLRGVAAAWLGARAARLA